MKITNKKKSIICVATRYIAFSDQLTSLLVIAVSSSGFIVLMALSYLADEDVIHFLKGRQWKFHSVETTSYWQSFFLTGTVLHGFSTPFWKNLLVQV